MRPDLPVLQHRADHAGRHRVELRDRGADGGGAVLVVLLVPLRPDGAQAVVGHHLFEQQLQQKKKKKGARGVSVGFGCLAVSRRGVSTHRVHVGQLLGHQVGLERQEVLLDLDLHFLLLPQAERTVPVETS